MFMESQSQEIPSLGFNLNYLDYFGVCGDKIVSTDRQFQIDS